MKFIEKLKGALERKEHSFKIRGEISGTDWVELSVTSLRGDPLHLGLSMDDVKFRFQTLTSGATTFTTRPYRLDNSHGLPIHQHFSGAVSSLNFPTVGGALVHVLGSDFDYLVDKR